MCYSIWSLTRNSNLNLSARRSEFLFTIIDRVKKTLKILRAVFLCHIIKCVGVSSLKAISALLFSDVKIMRKVGTKRSEKGKCYEARYGSI